MKSNQIDLGLEISRRHCKFGVPKTAAEIAAYCGISRQRIDQIEKRALRKIRIKLHCDKVLLDALKHR